jgi:hypothetical protein
VDLKETGIASVVDVSKAMMPSNARINGFGTPLGGMVVIT